jgi:hypothetical protein
MQVSMVRTNTISSQGSRRETRGSGLADEDISGFGSPIGAGMASAKIMAVTEVAFDSRFMGLTMIDLASNAGAKRGAGGGVAVAEFEGFVDRHKIEPAF